MQKKELTPSEEQQILKDYKEKVIKYVEKKKDKDDAYSEWKEIDKIEDLISEKGYCTDCLSNWDEKELLKSLETVKLTSALVVWDNKSWGADCLKHLIIFARSLERQGKDECDEYLKAVNKIWSLGVRYQVKNTYFFEGKFPKYYQTQKVWSWVFIPETLRNSCQGCKEHFKGLGDMLELSYLPNNVYEWLKDKGFEKRGKDYLLTWFEQLVGNNEEEVRKEWDKWVKEAWHPECLENSEPELFKFIKENTNEEVIVCSAGTNCYCLLPEWNCIKDVQEKREWETKSFNRIRLVLEVEKIKIKALNEVFDKIMTGEITDPDLKERLASEIKELDQEKEELTKAFLEAKNNLSRLNWLETNHTCILDYDRQGKK